jgi:hypothetical protein
VAFLSNLVGRARWLLVLLCLRRSDHAEPSGGNEKRRRDIYITIRRSRARSEKHARRKIASEDR